MTPEVRAALPYLILAATGAAATWSTALWGAPVAVSRAGDALALGAGLAALWRGVRVHRAEGHEVWEKPLADLYREDQRQQARRRQRRKGETR